MFNRRDGGKRTEKKQKGMRSHLQVMSRISKKLHLAVRLITGKRRIAAIFRAVKVLEELHNGENVSKKKKKERKRQELKLHFGPKHEAHCAAAQLLRHMLERHLTFHSSAAAASQKKHPQTPSRDKQTGAVHLPPGIEANGVGVTRADDGRGRKPGQSRRLHPQKSEPKPERG